MMKNYLEILRSVKLDFHDRCSADGIISVGKSAAFMYKKFINDFPYTGKLPKLIILPFNSDKMALDDVIFSSHPQMTGHSFNAGIQLLDFIDRFKSKNLTVLVSGGTSALVEHSENIDNTITLNSKLLNSGLDIIEVNKIRSANSFIKGGKLAKKFPSINFTVFSMSDIPFENGEELVGSMPFYSKDSNNSKLYKCADCLSLREHLSAFFNLTPSNTVYIDRFTDSVYELAELIKEHLGNSEKSLYISTEPTLEVSGDGHGGRMSHLALSVLPFINESVEFYALSSDGIDGNSDYAGASVTKLKRKYSVEETLPFLESFNSSDFLEKEGYLLKSGYTGINLNDFVLIRKKQEDRA